MPLSKYVLLILLTITIILWIIERFFILQLRGYLGERKVKIALQSLPKDHFVLLNDVILPSETGLTQIDHILVSIYGIFVIETKNMKGKIYGNAYSEEWTKYSKGRKVKFKNPIHQNYGHVKAVRDLLKLDENKIYSLVVMAGSAVLEFDGGNDVIYIANLQNYINSHSTPVFPAAQLDELVMIIEEARHKGLRNRQAHVRQVNEKIMEKESKKKSMICPKCGGNLILRKGKYGTFYGCSNYPGCKYTTK